jgi:hypothetical protein
VIGPGKLPQHRAVLHGHQTGGLRRRCRAAVCPVHVGPGAAGQGSPRVLKSTPAEAVVSLEMMVLLIRFTASASCSDTPAPSQPATLLAMMLLVTVTEFQCECGVPREVDTSVPLTCLEAQAAAAAASAALPMNQVGIDHQAGTGAVAQPGRTIRVGRGCRIRKPDRYRGAHDDEAAAVGGMVGLVLWLNRIELCSMSPL